MINSKNNYLKNRDKLFIALLITLIINAACLFLGSVQGISDFNYTLHELFFVPINISIFVVPAELIAFIYYSTRYFKDIWKATIIMNTIYKMKIFICIICMVLRIGFIYYEFNMVETSGVCNVINKVIYGNVEYIIVNDMKIECTKSQYNIININTEYLLIYKWNRLKPNIGKLENIKRIN